MMLAPQDIPLDQIRPSRVARPVAPGQVMALAESIRQIGLLQPISVRPITGGYEIIAGGHRCEAARTLEWPTIPAFVRSDDDLHAELALIDENLIRNELSPAERALAQARRKKIYEALHPETKVGATGKGRAKVRQLGEPNDAGADRYTKQAADKQQASERTVQREVSRGEALPEAILTKAAGTALDTGEQLDALAKLTPQRAAELVDRAAAGDKVNAVAAVKAEKRDAKEKALADKTVSLPLAKFNVIYADPPWRFEPYSRETGMDRAPENHYPTMTLQQILDLPVPTVAADDCVLFLWATVPMLPEAFQVMTAWGFTYKSHCIWNKNALGTGYWFRNKHELLLVGVKGDIPAPLPGTQYASVIDGPVKDHSRKPIIFRGMIEGLFPNLPKIELFARTPAPGWGQWGKEAPEIAIDDNEASIDHVTAEDRLMDAHRADDNDGVRNAPEGGFEIEAERGAVTSVSLPEDDSVQPTAANVTPVGEAASTGPATVSASCAGSAGSPPEDDDVLDIRKFAGGKFFRGAA